MILNNLLIRRDRPIDRERLNGIGSPIRIGYTMKEFGALSPSLSQRALDFCLQLISSCKIEFSISLTFLHISLSQCPYHLSQSLGVT